MHTLIHLLGWAAAIWFCLCLLLIIAASLLKSTVCKCEDCGERFNHPTGDDWLCPGCREARDILRRNRDWQCDTDCERGAVVMKGVGMSALRRAKA